MVKEANSVSNSTKTSNSENNNPENINTHPDFDALVSTLAILRSPGGCPWDREQTHASIARNMVEEAYEAVDAIESNDIPHILEELGDVLLQVVLHSQIAQDAGEFTIDDVCRDVNTKMIRRHPHVFGQETANTAGDVNEIWEVVKQAEKNSTLNHKEGILDGIPSGFPALMQTQKIEKKIESHQSCPTTLDEAQKRAEVAMGEILDVDATAEKDDIEAIFGDTLDALVVLARKYDIDAETALRKKCARLRKEWSNPEV